jgi:hypothetical protein
MSLYYFSYCAAQKHSLVFPKQLSYGMPLILSDLPYPGTSFWWRDAHAPTTTSNDEITWPVRRVSFHALDDTIVY